jgi:hypothetical protein
VKKPPPKKKKNVCLAYCLCGAAFEVKKVLFTWKRRGDPPTEGHQATECPVCHQYARIWKYEDVKP